MTRIISRTNWRQVACAALVRDVGATLGISRHATLLGLLLMMVLPVAVYAAPAREEGPPPLVTVVPVVEQDVNLPAEHVGHIEAIQEVDLRARVSGFLEQVNFKEGSNVKAGDLLYLIEQAPYQARVAAAKAVVARAEAAVSRTGRYLERLRNASVDSIPATEVDVAEADALQAAAELESARAALELAQLDLRYTRITAPINGRIGATSLSKGNLAGPESGSLAKIVQLSPIRVQYALSENDRGAVEAARAAAQQANPSNTNSLQVRLRLPDGSLLEAPGRIDFLDNRVDPKTGTLAVRAIFANRDGKLLPGQYVTVLVSQSQPREKPLVPQAAVLEDREGRYVLLVNGQDQVEQRRITTGKTIGTNWVAESGLNAGDLVITQGLQKVHPGQSVKTVIDDAAQKD